MGRTNHLKTRTGAAPASNRDELTCLSADSQVLSTPFGSVYVVRTNLVHLALLFSYHVDQPILRSFHHNEVIPVE
jgi:hypothetical protein